MATLRSTSIDGQLATSVTTLVVAAPAGMAVGDVVVVMGVFNSTSVTVTAAFTTSTNALTQRELCRSGAQMSSVAFYAVVQAADVGNTITLTFSVAVRSAAVCECWSGVNTTTPIRTSGQTAGAATAATPSPSPPTLSGVLSTDPVIVGFGGRPSVVTGRPAAYVATGTTTGWNQDRQSDNGTTSSFDPAMDVWSKVNGTDTGFQDQFQIPSGTNVVCNWAVVSIALQDGAGAAPRGGSPPLVWVPRRQDARFRVSQPYQSRQRFAYPLSLAGVVDALAATSTGVGNVTADLSVTHKLATTATGVGATTSALSVKHNLASGPVGVGATTAALSVKHNLATGATGVGAVSGALSVTHRLQTVTTGVGRTTAALSLTHLLGASGVGVGRSTAALSVTHALGVSSTGVGRVTAALTVAVVKALAGTPAGVGQATATLSIKHLLAATVIGVANTSAALSGGSAIAPVDGTGTGWYRQQLRQVAPRPVVQLSVKLVGVGAVRPALSVWSQTFTSEEIDVLAALVDEEDLAVLLTI